MQQRSPIVFWLFVAATLSLDAVIFTWLAGERFPTTNELVAFQALVISQLSAVCIWSATRAPQTLWTRMNPFLATVLAALATTMYTPVPEHYRGAIAFMSFLGYHGLHTVLLLALLWLLQRTKFWGKRTGVVRRWQYSLFHVLVVMTVVALLAALLRNNLLSEWLNIIFLVSSVALALASVVLWSFSWHWVLRFASILGLAILVGICAAATLSAFMRTGATRLDWVFFRIIGTYYLIQALMLSIWLGCGIVLVPATNESGEKQAAERVGPS